MPTPSYNALVKLSEALVDEQFDLTSLITAFEKIDDWEAFIAQAELHGLSVMLSHFDKTQPLGLPRHLQLQLKALTLRHQKVLAAREIVLQDVADIFQQNNIPFALLKGAALSPLIYAPPWLRPMRDIDILVKPEQAQLAQQTLRQIGFTSDDFKAGYLFEHHHLPISTRIQDGFTMSLEVHHDALSGDVDASITLHNLMDELHIFELAGKQVYALGHADMLKHLCHHTFEPANTIKLGAIIDFVRYANVNANDIDWQRLNKLQPNISNALCCIHILLPLPQTLQSKLDNLPVNWHPSGIGEGFKPLSQIMRLASKSEKVDALFSPSQWWMHIFYDIKPQSSLFISQWVRHPMTVTKWLLRRYMAAKKSKKMAHKIEP